MKVANFQYFQKKSVFEDCVRVAQSLLEPRLGRALFATRDIDVGEIVCSYGGDLLTNEQVAQLQDTHGILQPRTSYLYQVSPEYIVDGHPSLQSTAGHKGHFINDPKGIDGAHENCQSMCRLNRKQQQYEILIVATQSIANGEEMWMGYGDDYWTH